VALLDGFIAFRAVDQGTVTLQVCGSLSGDSTLVGLLGEGCMWDFWVANHCFCLGSIELKSKCEE